MRRITLIGQLRYRFDNLMARGTAALVIGLGLFTALFIFIISLLDSITGIAASDDNPGPDLPQLLWSSLLHALGASSVGNDTGSPLFIGSMFVVTLGGIFIVSILIGIITSGIQRRLEALRRGRSFVVERNHTLVLGWSPQIFAVLSELMIANANQRRACIVILADRDVVDMDEEIRARVRRVGRTHIVLRTGNPLDMSDLEIANPNDARAIIIISPTREDADMHVIKTMLAILNHPHRRAEPYHIVAQIREAQNLEAARMIGCDEAQLLLESDLISRIIAQTCRQSGLSVVYTELLNFEGDEIYFAAAPSLVGKRFGDVLLAYEDSAVMGLHTNGGCPLLNPPMDRLVAAGDQVIAISADDNTVKPSPLTNMQIDESAIVQSRTTARAPERTLLLGWNRRGLSTLTQLDNYAPPESEVMIVAHAPDTRINAAEQVRETAARLKNLRVTFREGDSADRYLLDRLSIPSYQHVIVLSYADMLETQEADAKTLVTLLHLRDIRERSQQKFSIVSEMLDLRNRQLAEVTQADDFIVSDHLVSLLMAQAAENKYLKTVFDELFRPEGSEIYLKPAEEYVRLAHAITFYTVVESARRRNEVALGYRLNRYASAADRAYGVVVNPNKSDPVAFEPGDKVIVLAEE
mgnify:FL=1